MGAKSPSDPGMSAADRENVRISDWKASYYDKSFKPIEEAMIKRTEYTAGERNRVRGNVAADTAAAFKNLSRQTVSAGGQSGAKIGSGSMLMSQAGNVSAQGAATGVGRAAADLGGRLQSENEQFVASQLGQNMSAQLQTNLAMVGQRQNQVSMQKAFLKAQEQNQRMEAAGAIAGSAAAKYMHVKEAKALAAEEQAGLKSALDWEGVELPEISIGGATPRGVESALAWKMPKLPTIGF